MATEIGTTSPWQSLLSIMDELREKCPWDKKQTIHTLSKLTIEEVYELVDAIRREDYNNIKEELGDNLLHIVFYAKIAQEKGIFNINDVIENLNEKLIRRHPHIYGETQVSDDLEVKTNWEKIKKSEKNGGVLTLSGVPDALPSIIRAYRMQEKAASVGFDWDSSALVLDKVQEELQEIHNAQSKSEKEEELGDLLFTIINYARKENLDPELALQKSNDKFKRRFNQLEQLILDEKKQIDNYNLTELETLWQIVKSNE